LLRELINCYIKNNKNDTKELKDLEKAFNEIKSTTTEINENVKKNQNIQKVTNLQMEFTKNFDYLNDLYEKDLKLKKENLVKPIPINIIEPGSFHN
jgi:hypothetical protein